MTGSPHLAADADRLPSLDRLDLDAVRADFPGLAQEVHGKPLVYLDNAASAQKPRAVIEAVRHHYACDASNVHRGVHMLSWRATEAYEGARRRIQKLIGADSDREVVFVRGTTEAINLVAQSFVRPRIQPGDEILITEMEHHSNIVPWQMLRDQAGAVLQVVPITDEGKVDLEAYLRLLGPKTRFVSVVHVSNALGTINPVEQMVAVARDRGVPVMLDGAQAVPHLTLDVRQLECDFYAFSGHKFYGPTGIGVLYGREEHLEAMPPYQGGGEMISSVTFEKTIYSGLPHKFEAGTPNIAGAVGLGAAAEYITGLGYGRIAAQDDDLLHYATESLGEVPGMRIIGTAHCKSMVLSFVLEGVHAHDIGTVLDRQGIAIRTGHHCAQPVMRRFGVPATARASFSFYNTRDEVDALVAGLHKVVEMFR